MDKLTCADLYAARDEPTSDRRVRWRIAICAAALFAGLLVALLPVPYVTDGSTTQSIAIALSVPSSPHLLWVRSGVSPIAHFIMAGINTADEVLFVAGLTFLVGLAFQLPGWPAVLVRLEITSRRTLERSRRYLLLGTVIVAALVTPSTDPLSMMLVAVPLYLFYEAGLLLARLIPAGSVGAVGQSS
ncbi:MAG: twin-arginine translocase subunit TatC [Chloroflexi bacterium]|nr:twin-arginine translocase subunit TatC [Chloroflexota bacterium]